MQLDRQIKPKNLAKYAALALIVGEAVYYFLKSKQRADFEGNRDTLLVSPHSFESSTEKYYNLNKSEDRIDQMVEDAFPASDAPSYGHAIARIAY